MITDLVQIRMLGEKKRTENFKFRQFMKSRDYSDRILRRIAGHLRSAVSYAGARSLAEARARVLADPASYLILLSEPSRRESYDR